MGAWTAPPRLVLAVCAAAMVVATSMTFTVAVMAPFMIDDGVVGLTSLGAIPAAYYLAASSASRPAGRLADALGGRRSIALMCALNASALLLLSLAPTLWVMVVAALLGGSAMALSNPATNLVVMSAFEPGRRGAALGWKQAGVPISGMLAGLLLPALASEVGWRWTVVASVVAPLACGLAAGLTLPETGVRRRVGDRSDTGRVRAGSLLPFAFLMGVATGALNTYLVVFGVDAGMSPTAAGLVAAGFSASAAASRIGWAVVVERIGRPRGILAVLASLAAVATVALPHSPLGWPVLLMAVLCGGAVLGWQAAAQLTVLSSIPTQLAGTGSAVLMRAFFAGLLVGPLVFAVFLDVSGSYRVSFALLGLIAGTAAVVMSASPLRIAVADGAPPQHAGSVLK